MEGKGDITRGSNGPTNQVDSNEAGGGDCDKEKEKCKKKEPKGSLTCDEIEGECEQQGEDDLWNTAAKFYVSKGGEIINEGALSDPESIQSTTTIGVDDLDLPEDDDFRDWTQLDPSDDEEQEELRVKYFDLFKVNEPEDIYHGEQDLGPEDVDYWKEYFEKHYTNQHVNVHYPEKFLKLNLHHDRVTDVTFVPQHFPALKFLDISKNFVQNIRCLGKLKNLVHLNASDNEITRFLDICTKIPHPLQEIDLSKNQITQIVRFNRFLGLVNVNLAYNRLSVINNFHHCYFLRFLNLSHNNISEIYNLDCPNLLVLLLQDNKLQDISSLSKCGELRYLNISKNNISDLSILRLMPRLVQLRVARNDIGLKEVDILKCLIHMSHLRISPNPATEIALSRQMLIFSIPQIRYLDKKLIIPQEIVEANNIFKPTLEKIAFEDHVTTMLEKATQSAYLMFREFSEMYPLPPILLLVGTSKSKAEDLAMNLKHKFHQKILLGGIHSTATTIESGNHHDDIPISLEHFMEMKKRGHLFSTSSILGRLCGFSATQFIKAVEHGALLLAISIPLETAICLRKWGFKATTILLLPSDRPHFNVDNFLEKEKRRLTLHFSDIEEVPLKIRDHRISFTTGDQGPPKHTLNHQRHSILKHHAEGDIPLPLLSSPSQITIDPSQGFDVSDVNQEVEPNVEVSLLNHGGHGDHRTSVEGQAFVGHGPLGGQGDQDEKRGEWEGESEGMGELLSMKEVSEKISEGKLSIFGIEILNPNTIEGIDWKRTILWSNFYESILTMDENFHFLLICNIQDPVTFVSKEILDKTISTLGYNLLHGPTLVYFKINQSNPTINYQLIVVTQKDYVIQSCSEIPKQVSIQTLFCEDAGEGGYLQYLRPSSPLYNRLNEEDGEFEDGALPIQKLEIEDIVTDEKSSYHLNKFKHRDALEFSILRTREEYLKYHLDNPGFFTTILDTRDLEECQKMMEEVINQMVQEFEEDPTNSKRYPLVESYSHLVSKDDKDSFIDHRLDLMSKCDLDMSRRHSAADQHGADSALLSSSSSCPMNLLCTNIPKGFARGHVCALQRAEACRKKLEEKDDALGKRLKIWKTCPPIMEPIPMVDKIFVPEYVGESAEIEGESRRKECQCGEFCTCQPPRRRHFYDSFKRDSILTELGYDGDA